MKETNGPVEVRIAGSRDSEDHKVEQPKGTFHYAFVYCTLFLLALLVTLQFEPLVVYSYPVLLLVAAVLLLFIATTFRESGQKRSPQSRRQPLIIEITIMIASCLVLLLLLIPENPVLILLIPLTLGLLILEGMRVRCSIHSDST